VLDGPLPLVCQAAKVPELSAHAFRRTWEGLMRQAHVDELVRRSIAGWRSNSAQAIYAVVGKDEREVAGSAVVELILGGRGKEMRHPGATPEVSEMS
jgi:hypothetical protein